VKSTSGLWKKRLFADEDLFVEWNNNNYILSRRKIQFNFFLDWNLAADRFCEALRLYNVT